MKVKDVIAALQTLDPELPVLANKDEGVDGAYNADVDFVGVAYAQPYPESPYGWYYGIHAVKYRNDAQVVFIGRKQDVLGLGTP